MPGSEPSPPSTSLETSRTQQVPQWPGAAVKRQVDAVVRKRHPAATSAAQPKGVAIDSHLMISGHCLRRNPLPTVPAVEALDFSLVRHFVASC